MRVLIVEDEAAIAELLRRWLTGWRYDVKAVASAADAVDSMMAEPSDIMLCDIRMPGDNGLWLAEQVRTKWPRTAIIMASGVMEMDAVQEAKRLGAIDFVTKPFMKELLWQALERALVAVTSAADYAATHPHK